MTARNPLVLVDGQVQELPSQDSIDRAAAGTLVGDTLAPNVVFSNLSTVGQLYSLAVTNYITALGGIKSYDSTGGPGGTLQLVGSTGAGVAGAGGGHGFIELLGAGATSNWTSFAGGLARRRGGINIQAGKAAGDSGSTFFSGSNINITGQAATTNGTAIGIGSTISIQSGVGTTASGFSTGAAVLNLTGANSAAGGGVSMTSGSGGASSNASGGQLYIKAGDADGSGNGGMLTLRSGGSATGAAGDVFIQVGTSLGTSGAFRIANAVERFRITYEGAWSVGSNGNNFGTTGQVLTSQGAGAPPVWADSKLGGYSADSAYDSYGSGTIPVRHPSGYLFSNFFNCAADVQTVAPSHIAGQWSSDNFIRWQTWADFRTNLFTSPQLTGTVKVGSNDFRLKNAATSGGYGLILRNDGGAFYMLTTALNDADGAWTALRPFTINLANGDLTLNSPYLNSPTLNGAAAFNGYLNVTGTGAYLPANTTISAASGSSGAAMFTAQGTGGTAGASYISFHRPGAYAAHFGLDTDNKWKVGGWSMGAAAYEIFHAGNTKTVNGQSLIGSGNISTGGSAPLEISTDTNAVADGSYVFLASLTLTLPASPAVGTTVSFVNMSGVTTCVIARNGSLVMGLAQDMTVNVNYGKGTLKYSATNGWVLMAA